MSGIKSRIDSDFMVTFCPVFIVCIVWVREEKKLKCMFKEKSRQEKRESNDEILLKKQYVMSLDSKVSHHKEKKNSDFTLLSLFLSSFSGEKWQLSFARTGTSHKLNVLSQEYGFCIPNTSLLFSHGSSCIVSHKKNRHDPGFQTNRKTFLSNKKESHLFLWY